MQFPRQAVRIFAAASLYSVTRRLQLRSAPSGFAMTLSPETNNPYVPPRGAQAGIDTQVEDGLPRYTKVIAIADLLCSGGRAIAFLVFVANYFAPGRQHELMTGSVAAGLALVLGLATFGILGDLLILLHKPAGLWFGVAAVAATIASLGMSAWQTSIQATQFAPAAADRTLYLVAVGFVTVGRLALLGLYVGALVQYANWIRRRCPSPTAF